jgi:hypothetical protein
MSGIAVSVAAEGQPEKGRPAMAYEFQVTVDCADPHTMADWWAETLGWQVQPQDEAFIRRMISAGHAADSDTKLHNGALVWKEGQGTHTWVTLADPEGNEFCVSQSASSDE